MLPLSCDLFCFHIFKCWLHFPQVEQTLLSPNMSTIVWLILFVALHLSQWEVGMAYETFKNISKWPMMNQLHEIVVGYTI